MNIVSLVLATAVAAVIGTSPLLAQSADTPSSNASPRVLEMNPPTHPAPNQWARDREWYGRPGWPQGGYGWMGPGMMGPHTGWMMGGGPGWMMGQYHPGRRGHHGWQRWHRRSPGARFTFTRGNARVDIQCPANQSLKECVDAASTLIDKVRGMGPPPPPPAAPGKQP